MNVVKAQFYPVNNKTIDQIDQALLKIQSIKDQTVAKIKRLRSVAAKRITTKRVRTFQKLKSLEHSQQQEWDQNLALKRKELEEQLTRHVHQKCRDVIHEILRALIGEVPEIALIHANKKLDSLLAQLPNQQNLSVVASAETLSNPLFFNLCTQHQISQSTDNTFTPGAFSLSLPHGKVLASVEDDLRHLLENWGEGLELMRELQSFFENQNG